jgi:tetratricopeptide (TPR) repeat protein
MSRLGLSLAILAGLIAGVGSPSPPSAEAASGGRFDCLALYDAGDYSAAVACFESLETGGAHNGHLLYNLGNAHYRAGDPARALLAYRRASLYLPRDGDLKANLGSARDQIQDDLIPPDIRSPLMSTLLAPYDSLSQKELLITGAVAWVLLMGMLALRLRQRFDYTRLSAALLGSIALFGLLGGVARSYQTENQPIAVVLSEEATVRSGRDVRSTDLVRLHAGAEVGVLEVNEQWMQVALSNGTRGWLPANALGLVRPLPQE